MPKVKKKAASKRARSRSKAKAPGVLEKLHALWVRFSRAFIAALVLIMAIAAALLWSGGYFGVFGERLTRLAGDGVVSAGLGIQRITVKGLDQTGEDDLLQAVGPVIGSSILHFDPHSARARVEELGWVRVAAVSRLMPNTIHVSVREREPAAVWQISGALQLVDETGAIIREVGAYEYAYLPLIVGAGAPAAAAEMLQALRAEPELWSRASALIRVSERRWNLRTQNNIDIKFPEYGVNDAVHYLAQVQSKTGLLDEPLEYVDLRDSEKFVYRVKGGGEEPING